MSCGEEIVTDTSRRFDTVPERDGQTDGRTDGQTELLSISSVSIAVLKRDKKHETEARNHVYEPHL